MLSKEQCEEIKEHLNASQNPVFFFDNDCDGLMAFVLMRRYIGRGKGVAIKSFPELDKTYVRKVEEFNSDYIFILDKPQVSQEFIEEIQSKNIPIVWVDHHDVEMNFKDKNLFYYNPAKNKNKSNEPTSYLAYKITGNKEDMWLAMVGCIADNFMPEFYKENFSKYPELFKKISSSAFEVLYETEFGKLIMMINFALKDRTSNVVSMINLLVKIKSPFEILKEDDKNYMINQRYKYIQNFYTNLLEKAKKIARTSNKIVFFQYGGEFSISADLANELSYCFPGKVIIVAYLKGSIANISIRGKNIRTITINAVKTIEGATGGGHENATGAKMSSGDLSKFREFFEKEIRKNYKK
ncbi:MAG: DHH family phosphoesterase [Candidatus Pacearchaeota archaeon]|jgi:single-stranded DNA-specific DHH superfamily exonuclease